MRKIYYLAMKKIFYVHLIKVRSDLKITQAQMAERLVMDTRSYVNLDHGKSGRSALTLALFLIYSCSDPQAFLDDLRQEFEGVVKHAD